LTSTVYCCIFRCSIEWVFQVLWHSRYLLLDSRTTRRSRLQLSVHVESEVIRCRRWNSVCYEIHQLV